MLVVNNFRLSHLSTGNSFHFYHFNIFLNIRTEQNRGGFLFKLDNFLEFKIISFSIYFENNKNKQFPYS